jgi:hypothetical protein
LTIGSRSSSVFTCVSIVAYSRRVADGAKYSSKNGRPRSFSAAMSGRAAGEGGTGDGTTIVERLL